MEKLRLQVVSCLGKVPSMMDGQPRLALQLQRLSWEAAACPSGLLVKGSFMGGTLCALDSEPLRKGPDIEIPGKITSGKWVAFYIIIIIIIIIISVKWGPQEEMQWYRDEGVSLPPPSPRLETNLITN